uniref:Uncharacterized protein n=1 Tax=Oryza barthii TaxID=65489 RepID=A0A0D3HVB8_9ORYZ
MGAPGRAGARAWRGPAAARLCDRVIRENHQMRSRHRVTSVCGTCRPCAAGAGNRVSRRSLRDLAWVEIVFVWLADHFNLCENCCEPGSRGFNGLWKLMNIQMKDLVIDDFMNLNVWVSLVFFPSCMPTTLQVIATSRPLCRLQHASRCEGISG